MVAGSLPVLLHCFHGPLSNSLAIQVGNLAPKCQHRLWSHFKTAASSAVVFRSSKARSRTAAPSFLFRKTRSISGRPGKLPALSLSSGSRESPPERFRNALQCLFHCSPLPLLLPTQHEAILAPFSDSISCSSFAFLPERAATPLADQDLGQA